MTGFPRQRWPDLLLALLTAAAVFAAVVVFPRWKAAGDRGGQQPAEPFLIAGNLYYVAMHERCRGVSAHRARRPRSHRRRLSRNPTLDQGKHR